MQNMSEKRPERILTKSEGQETICPTCGRTLLVKSSVTSAQCSCGQLLNWGLRKI